MMEKERAPDAAHDQSGIASEPTSALFNSVAPTSTLIASEVKRAREELRLGRAYDAIARLVRIEQHLAAERGRSATPSDVESVYALLGRLYLQTEQYEQSRSNLERALSLMSVGPATTDEQFLDRGIVLAALGRPEDAIVIMSELRARQTHPNAETLTVLAIALRAVNRLDEARVVLTEAVALVPGDGSLRVALGQVLEAQGHADAALEQYSGAIEALLLASNLGDAEIAIDRALRLGPPRASLLAAKGDLLRRLGRLTEAVEPLEMAVSLDPDLATARANLGAVLSSTTGRHLEALAHLDRAVALDPTVLFARFWRGATLLRLERYEEALATLEELVRETEELPELLNLSGMALAGLERHDQAVEVFRRSVQIRPEDPAAHLYLAEELRRLGRSEEALVEAEAALSLDAKNRQALEVKAQVLQALGRTDEAIGGIRDSIADEPQGSEARAFYRKLLRAADRIDELMKELDAALSVSSDDAEALRTKAEVLVQIDRPQDAIEPLKRLVEVLHLPHDYVALSDAYRSLGRYDEALNAADQAIARGPDVALTVGTRGQALAALGHTDDGLRELQRAAALEPGVRWIHNEIGRLLADLGRHDEAVDAYRRALGSDDRQNAAVWVRIARVRRSEGAIGAVQEALRDALRSDPESVSARVELADVYRSEGKHTEGLQVVDEALVRDPRDVRARQVRGQLLVNLGRNEEALTECDEVLRLDPNGEFGYALKAATLEGLDRHTLGLDTIRLGLDAVPNDPALQAIRASLLLGTGEFVEAFQSLKQVDDQGINPDVLAWINLLRGVALLYDGRPVDAIPVLRASQTANPEDMDTRLRLADALRQAGLREDSDKIVNDVVIGVTSPSQLDPIDISSLGWAYHLLGDYDRAADLLASAISRLPSMVGLQFDFALTLLCKGGGSAAIREYDRGVEQLRTKSDARRRYGLVVVARRDLDVVLAEREDLRRDDYTKSIHATLDAQVTNATDIDRSQAEANAAR
jgi:tetratricopeptide (TPR) repeat protein